MSNNYLLTSDTVKTDTKYFLEMISMQIEIWNGFIFGQEKNIRKRWCLLRNFFLMHHCEPVLELRGHKDLYNFLKKYLSVPLSGAEHELR